MKVKVNGKKTEGKIMRKDREWYSAQLKVKIRNLRYREVYREFAYLGSGNPDRLFFAGHSTIARKLGISIRTVQRAVKYFKREGLLGVLSVGSGRTQEGPTCHQQTTGTYQILG